MRRHLLGKYLLAAVVIIGMVAASCTPFTTAAAPTLTITAPADGASLPPGPITVTAQASNFNIVDKQGQPTVAGEGHVHFYLDVTPPTTPGQPAVTATGTYASISGTSYTWPNVNPGTHKLSAQLVNNDHTPLSPPVVTQVTITVTGGTSGATTPSSGSITLSPTPGGLPTPAPSPTAAIAASPTAPIGASPTPGASGY